MYLESSMSETINISRKRDKLQLTDRKLNTNIMSASKIIHNYYFIDAEI